MASDPPPIKFMRSERASKSPVDTMYHEFEYRLNAQDKKSTKMSKKMLMFENGDAEMWCDWRTEFDDLIRLAPLTIAEQKSKAALTLFKGKVLHHFKEYTWLVELLKEDRVKRDKTPWDKGQVFYKVLDRVTKEFFPVKHTYRRQRASIYATMSTLVASSVFVSLWLVCTESMPEFCISPGNRTRKASNIVIAC
jgi:hypothetical protein